MGAWCVLNPSACTDGVRGAFRQPNREHSQGFGQGAVLRLTWPGRCAGGLLGACARRLLAWIDKKIPVAKWPRRRSLRGSQRTRRHVILQLLWSQISGPATPARRTMSTERQIGPHKQNQKI